VEFTKFFLWGLIGLAVLIALPVVITLGAIALVLGIVGVVLGAVFFALLGVWGIIAVPFLIGIFLVAALLGHPWLGMLFAAAVLYLGYRWWQRQHTHLV
jgi:hypothetical protein